MSTVILWPQKVAKSKGGIPDQTLRQPDGKANPLNAENSVTVQNFQGGFYPDLLPLLNGVKGGDVVSTEMLAMTNIIAFEVNGESPASAGGWESSRWIFNDGSSTPVAIDWDERTKPNAYPIGVVANGSMDASNYAPFFGFTFPPAPKITIVSYILFTLPPTIDITSPNFTITVSAWADGQHGEGTPDPDAIGILVCTGR